MRKLRGRPPDGSKYLQGHRAGGRRRSQKFRRSADTMHPPTSSTRRKALIDDEVVHQYLRLLTQACQASGRRIGVGATDPGFWQMLRSEHYQWEDVRGHLNLNHQVNLVPAFFGAQTAGHWAILIIDNEVSPDSRKLVFVDSSPSRDENFRLVKRLLRNLGNDESDFVLMNSPHEAQGSNDCALFTLAACAHWVFREGNYLPSSFEFNTGIQAAQFGTAWRRHTLESIANRSIDPNDPCLRWMVLSNE